MTVIKLMLKLVFINDVLHINCKNVLRCFITTKTLLKDKLHNHRTL